MKSNKKSNKKIIIAAVVLCAIVMMALTACKGVFGNKETLAPIVVTDENGVPITNENGEAITIIPEGEVVEVTNANGEKVYDENGEVKTSVKYESQEVGIPVTNSKGEAVTDENGKWVTTKIWVPATTKEENQIIQKPLTDAQGNTATDNQGNVVTYTVISTTSDQNPTPNSSDYNSTFGGTGLDKFVDVAATKDGGFVALMLSDSRDGSIAGIDEAFKGQSSVIVKYDQNGKILWKKFIGGDNGCSLLSIAVDASDNIVAAGYTQSTNIGTHYDKYDCVIYKMNSSGDVQWTKTFGGKMSEGFNSVSVANDGTIIATGFCYSSDGSAAVLGIKTGESAGIVLKYSANGDIAFAKKIGSTTDELYESVVDSSGNIFIVGSFTSKNSASLFTPFGKADTGVVKLNSKGDIVWKYQFGGSAIERCSGITLSPDGGCVIVGRTQSDDHSLSELKNFGGYDAVIFKLTSGGALSWAKTFKGYYDDSFYSVVSSGNGYYVVGSSNSSNRDLKTVGNRGGLDGIVIKYSEAGEVQSVEGFGGSKADEFSAVCVLKNGKIIAVGSTLSSDGDLVGGSAVPSGTKTVGVVAKFK